MKKNNSQKKAILLLLAFFLFLNGAFALETSSPVYYKNTKGYLAIPKNAKKDTPAIILIHEWWGLNEEIKQKTRDFAEAGYVVLAVDLYNGKATTKPQEARKLAGAVREDLKTAFANLESAIDYVRNLEGVDSKRIASIGWCFGGGWSYQIAKNNLGTKASIIYYGRFNPADDLAQMRAAILGHFAEKDRGIKVDSVKEFQAKLKTLSGDHEIYIYPNTSHGFSNSTSSIYDEEASKLAHQRTLEFLKKHL